MLKKYGPDYVDPKGFDNDPAAIKKAQEIIGKIKREKVEKENSLETKTE